jgi:pyruvate dehydrogenase E2 component (dihydrolipoamide acetyltransferase)
MSSGSLLRARRLVASAGSRFAIVRAAAPLSLVAQRRLDALSQPTRLQQLVSLRCAGTFSAGSIRTFTAFANKYPPHEVYTLPALSPTMESGTIASWNKHAGDAFVAGDVLCAIETDKALVDYEAQDDGIVAKLLQKVSDECVIGTPICVVVEDASHVAAFADYRYVAAAAESTSSSNTDAAATAAATSIEANAAPATITAGPSFLFPSARHLAESKGLDATVLIGTGKDGRVTKGDVMEAIKAGSLPALAIKPAFASFTAAAATAPTPAPSATSTPPPLSLSELILPTIETAGSYTDLPNTKMRKIIASRLTTSKREVPHFYTSAQVELDTLMKLRKQLVNKHDVKISVNDFVIRCSALALRDVPRVNATFDVHTNTVRANETIDISVAVATPTGLITPIVFGTDKLGLAQITSTVRDLAGRARDGKLAPAEYQGGTFSISNLGMFGIDEFSAVINPPQAAILAVGGGSRRVVPTAFVDGADVQPTPSVKTIMTARLSADRRVVDEATAALFMKAFSHYMNEPELLLL